MDVPSVSGIDFSSDGGYLLANYQNYHGYEFCLMEPRIGMTERKELEVGYFLGITNSETFLKGLKYWGPNDEYVIGGCDSGKIRVFHRMNGCLVASFIADSSICNGVNPNPTLPILGSFGIDHDAKIWSIMSSDLDPLEELERKEGVEDETGLPILSNRKHKMNMEFGDCAIDSSYSPYSIPVPREIDQWACNLGSYESNQGTGHTMGWDRALCEGFLTPLGLISSYAFLFILLNGF